MIETLLFDLDNTLLDFNQAERIAVSKTLENFQITPAPSILKRYSELNLAQWKLLEQGKISREQVKLRRFQLLFSEQNIDAPAEEAAKIYEFLLAHGHYFMDGAEELLEYLYKKDYCLCAASNGPYEQQINRLKSAGMLKYFDHCFVSEKIGADKPGKQFFDGCMRNLPGIQPEDCMMIGDSLTADIAGGTLYGMSTCWYVPSVEKYNEEKSKSGKPAEYIIHELRELKNIL
mgnify:CR=1 FL=1